jgi:hypothetical protein
MIREALIHTLLRELPAQGQELAMLATHNHNQTPPKSSAALGQPHSA